MPDLLSLLRTCTSLFILASGLWLSGCQPAEVFGSEPRYDTLELPEPPNILWIVAEDLSAYLPPFGDSTVATPNLSRLAAEGVRYPNVFSPSGVCAPSRAAIATGMYPTRIGAMHMRTGPWFSFFTTDRALENYPRKAYEAIPPAGVHMHSTYLRKAGYYCTNNPKQDYQFRSEMVAWDESSRQAHWRNRAEGQPFFAIFNLDVTHESMIWRKAGDSLWIDSTLEVPIPPYLPDTDIGRRDVRRMYSNIAEMDAQVGTILTEIEEAGLLDETIIFWYGDHGGPLPRQKRMLYDSGLRVPMIIRYPGAQLAGTIDSQLISFVDFKPTLMSLAGIEPLDDVDGQAWLGAFRSDQPREYVHAAADRMDNCPDRVRAVRDKRYKYIRNYILNQPTYLPVKYRETMPIMQELLRLRDTGALNEIQMQWFRPTREPELLFDTYHDPHELNNLAGDPAYAQKLEELRSECDRWIAATNDKGLMPEEEFIAALWPDSIQPVTEKPQVRNVDGKLVITCPTSGAIIGYQSAEIAEDSRGAWNIYDKPIPAIRGKTWRIRAHRIGYRPSAEVRYSPGDE